MEKYKFCIAILMQTCVFETYFHQGVIMKEYVSNDPQHMFTLDCQTPAQIQCLQRCIWLWRSEHYFSVFDTILVVFL